MKRVVFVVRALWIGGIEKSLVNLLNNLDYSEFDVTCIITERETTLIDCIDKRCKIIIFDRKDQQYRYDTLYDLGQQCENPSKFHKMILWAGPIFRWIENLFYIQYIKKALDEYTFDVCVIYDVYVAEIAVKAIEAKKYIMFYHHGAMGHAYHDKIGYKKSDNIVIVSQNLYEKMRAKYPYYANKMLVIHNIMNAQEIITQSNENIPALYETDSFNIVSCGRLSYEKGMDIAVHVCAKIVNSGNRKIHWYIVGGGREHDNLERLIDQLKLNEYMDLLGEKDNPYPYLKQADLFVQTSRAEAYGLSLLEALILGIPVIATETDGAKEILRDGEMGILCGKEPAEIAAHILDILNDKEKYNELKRKADRLNIENDNIMNIKKIKDLLKLEK